MQDKPNDGRTVEAVVGAAGQRFDLHQSLPSCRTDESNAALDRVTRAESSHPKISKLAANDTAAGVICLQVHRQPVWPGEPRGQRCESTLTPREAEVLEWASYGKSNPEIATILGISQWTVKIHMSRVLRKLNASTRGHAIAKAVAKSVMIPR